MDERHWWIAKRISQAFGIDSSTSHLEAFICEANNLEKINLFLCMNGSNKLFVCGQANTSSADDNDDEDVDEEEDGMEHDQPEKRSNRITPVSNISSLLILDDLLKAPTSLTRQVDNSVVLYFIRHNTIHEVSQTHIHKEVFCGEIRNVSQILYNVYNDLLFAMFESNRNWGLSSEVTKAQSIRNMDKYVNAISEFSADSQNQKNMVFISFFVCFFI